ncbi:hypothetical protein NEUTE1DRAFT_121764 [Neurospora tetrasperma FGSC 2508]|uniref:Uncharacterized protein n=1 Tax=Neurospora tetrasperma (strain FGSC 2508 / ATCC MYA-4615 / P0657) TaxID=510951 RepID=F8MJP6_NEUT8|nr:uncharacterized protein NEUTE1DRAFT_121764 [Neurospora tetrasperma FGSC 2508]EGO57287.1 hypothetical protein NEUTE1DRAFT_121764 [Neurospora tetrasperma FGSC 2508]
MASRPTTPEAITPRPQAPTTPIRTGNRALSPPSKSPIATPPPHSPIPYLPWRDQITWDHLLHSAPIVDNFDDESDIETLAPQTPPDKILLSKERQAILNQRLQAGHGTHRIHYIVYDDYVADVHGNKIPDSHMILVTGDPRQNGGIPSFDGVDVEEGMVVEKRDGFWGVYEVDWDDDEEEEEMPVEQQIYQVFLEGAGGDHEEAWDVYQRFQAHKERQARKGRIYQVMLEELEGNEALAREVHARWCEEEEQRENSEDEGEEGRDDEQQDVFARATMWARAFRKGYEMRNASLQKSPTKSVSSSDVQLRDSSILQKSPTKSVSSDVPEDSNQSSESKQEPDVYDCLGEWAVLSNGEGPRRKTASNSMCEGTDSLIDTSIEQDQDVYDCLDEWARSLEQDTKHASFFNEASRLVDNKDSGKLIDIATKTADVYECLGFTDIDDNGKVSNETIATENLIVASVCKAWKCHRNPDEP